jgi:hypothetical protein
MSTEDQRRRWKAHWQEFDDLSAAWQEHGYSGPAPTYPELPDDLVGLTCGARTRAGTPCKQKAIYGNGRCKFHGGLATGPTTEAGKEQCRINGRKGGRPRNACAAETEALAQQGVRLLSGVAISEETEVTEPEETIVSAPLHGVVLGRGGASEIQVHERPESAAGEPKSWMLKEVRVSAICERCAMFASNGACLAVAKGVISSMPTVENCDVFSAF